MAADMDAIMHEIRTKPTVRVWPTAGRALDLGRNAAYDAARRKEIPTLKIGGRLVVPSALLLRMLGIETGAA
jgi:hypothetical protein